VPARCRHLRGAGPDWVKAHGGPGYFQAPARQL